IKSLNSKQNRGNHLLSSSSSFIDLIIFLIAMDIIFLPSCLFALVGSPQTPFFVILNDDGLFRNVEYVARNLFVSEYPRLALCIWTSCGWIDSINEVSTKPA